MTHVSTDTLALDLRTASLRRRFHATLYILAGLTFVGIGLVGMLNSAPGANAATTLTIQLKAPASLSANAGIRLAKLTNKDGRTCFRASRHLPGQDRSISESFCAH